MMNGSGGDRSLDIGGVMDDAVKLLSRALMSTVFLVYGAFKLLDVSTIVNNAGMKRFMDLVASGATAPVWLGYTVVAIEVLGGLAILVGFKTKWVAWGLFVWLIVVTVFGHPFWSMEGAARSSNQLNFYKNVAIMAAYLLLAIGGPGRYSLDNRNA
jgi:putative oxidoreductase